MPDDQFVGETPFTAEERVRIRQLMKNLELLEPGDVVEIKKIAEGGKMVRTLAIILGRIIAFAAVAFGVAASWKAFFTKVGG